MNLFPDEVMTDDDPENAAPEPPQHSPLVWQFDRLAEEGWEVVAALAVAGQDQAGHERAAVLMRLSKEAAMDRAGIW